MVKLNEISRTSTFAWSNDPLPLLATGTVAGAVDANFNSSSTLEIWDIFSPIHKNEPLISTSIDAKFHALAWSKPFESRSRGILAGGLENGVLELWDSETLIKNGDLSKASIFKSEKHTGPIKSLAFNPIQNHVLVTGGSKGEIYIWDTKKNSDPFQPGQAMTPMDDISSVAWNNSVSHIFASAGNTGYTSIWDLKAKREVLHLNYNGAGGRANLSVVTWHPNQSTKLVTASDYDGTPVILTWDLRNANAPEQILEGHKKGVLSLDWCKQDSELLLSSGKDNSTYLWNPISGEKLGEYPTTANWAFNIKFAPSAPDLFATASFDGKITIQSLQDTSPPVSSRVKSTNEDDFWNQISNTDTQQPEFTIKKAPKWLKRPASVSFGFGNKLVSVSTNADSKSSVSIDKFTANSNFQESSKILSEASVSNDYEKIVESRLTNSINATNKSDWNLLKELLTTDKSELLKKQISDKEEINGSAIDIEKISETAPETKESGDSFFDKLGSQETVTSYVPEGSFNIFSDSDSESDKKLINSILRGKTDEAIDTCIKESKIVEALILALDSSDEIKQKVRNYYFSKHDSSVSRLLYSTSTKNVTDIVANANVENWKDIALSISSYCTDKNEFNNKISELGDRILESGKSGEIRSKAITCYLAGGSLDKISAIWLSELREIEVELLKDSSNGITSPSDAHFEALNNFVEKVMVYRSATKLSGELSGSGIGPTCNAFLEYANVVAGYGQFDLADKFLELLPNDFAGLKLEKDRITKASGKAKQTVQKAKGFNRVPNLSGNSVYNSTPNLAPPTYNGVSSNYGSPYGVNGYSVPPTNISPLIKPAQLSSNPYKPVTPALEKQQPNPAFPPPPKGGVSSTPPPTSKSTKKENGGWNDLPTTFKPVSSSRRAAPAAVSSPYISQPTPVSVPQPSQGVPAPPPPIGNSRRSSAFAQQPVAPPPPRSISRSSSKASLPGIPNGLPAAPAPSQTTNRYAPPPNITPSQSPQVAPASIDYRMAPPPANGQSKNPYAPPPPANNVLANGIVSPRLSNNATPVVQAKSPYAPPPPNPYAPQPNLAPQQVGAPTNQYAAPLNTGAQTPVNPYGAPPIGKVVSQPPANPYGPPSYSTMPPAQYSTKLPQHSSGLPPQSIAAQSIAQQQEQQQQEPEEIAPVEPEKPKYPPGDREHIPSSSRPIFEILSAQVESIKPLLPAQYLKHLVDTEKRVNILFDHLNNEDLLSDETIEKLIQLSYALQDKDFGSAISLQLDIATTHTEEVGTWSVGVKRLISMVEATST